MGCIHRCLADVLDDSRGSHRGATEFGELDIFEGQGDPGDAHTFFGTIHDWVVTNGTTFDIANNNGQNT